jgi:hypothetical protein
MKKCSSSLAIKEMQVKTTLRFHLTPLRIAISRNTTNNQCWWGCGDKGTLAHCWECKLVQPLWKIMWRLLKNLNIHLPYDLQSHSWRYNQRNMTGYSRGTCTSMFIAALFTIAKLWKQSRWPSTDAWIKKMWYLYTMEFYSIGGILSAILTMYFYNINSVSLSFPLFPLYNSSPQQSPLTITSYCYF